MTLLISNAVVAPVLTMDATIAALEVCAVPGKVYEAARAAGLGRELPTEWFLQDIRN